MYHPASRVLTTCKQEQPWVRRTVAKGDREEAQSCRPVMPSDASNHFSLGRIRASPARQFAIERRQPVKVKATVCH
jgi:hypothetical protein